MEDARAPAFSDAGDVHACTLRASSRWRARRRSLALAFGAFSAVATPNSAAITAVKPGLVSLAQRAGPHISVPSVVTANPASRVMLPIRVDPVESVPNQSYVRIHGLPANVSLNEGHSIGAGSFAIPLYAVEALKANIPAGSSGRSELVISLVSADGMVLAEARTALVIGPPAAIWAPAEIAAGPRAQDLAAPQRASPPERAIASAPLPRRSSAEERGLSAHPAPSAPSAETAKPPATVSAEPAAPPIEDPRSRLTKASPKLARTPPSTTPCADLAITVEPRPAGMTALVVKSPCRAEQNLEVRYGAVATQATLDDEGAATVPIDLYAGIWESISVKFADGVRRILAPKTNEADQIYKLTVMWRAPAQLRLHAFEALTSTGVRSHVWAGASGKDAPGNAGHTGRTLGVMTTTSQPSQIDARMEVYSAVRPKENAGGTVSFMLGYEPHPENASDTTCSSSRPEAIDFEYTLVEPSSRVTSGKGSLLPQDCNRDANAEPRLQAVGLPTIRFSSN